MRNVTKDRHKKLKKEIINLPENAMPFKTWVKNISIYYDIHNRTNRNINACFFYF